MDTATTAGREAPAAQPVEPYKVRVEFHVIMAEADYRRLAPNLAPMIRRASIVVSVKNPENRGQYQARLLPGFPATSPTFLTHEIDRLFRSALIGRECADAAMRLAGTITATLPYQQNDWSVASSAIASEDELDGTLRHRTNDNARFVVLSIEAEPVNALKALGALDDKIWLSDINLRMNGAPSDRRRPYWGECVGPIRKGRADDARKCLESLISRGRLSELRALATADWLDILADASKCLPAIQRAAR